MPNDHARPSFSHRLTTSVTYARARRFFGDRLDPKLYLGLHVTVSLAVFALGAWLFGALVDSVLENESIVRWDISAAAWIHAHVTPAGLRAFQLVSDLGSPLFVSLLVAAAALWCWRHRERVLAVGAVAISVGAAILDAVLKIVIHRTRPEFGARFLHGQSFSFPSGHAFGSIVAFGLLAYLIVELRRPARAMRGMIWGAAALVILAVGVSRVYLGVHYPSDVIGGYAAGVAWLSICITGMRFARARRERSIPTTAMP